MSSVSICPASDLERDGHSMLRGVYDGRAIGTMREAIESALGQGDPAIRGDEGAIYAARNVLSLWPGVAEVWKVAPLQETLAGVLGPRMGLCTSTSRRGSRGRCPGTRT
jgi:hypothetical protein